MSYDSFSTDDLRNKYKHFFSKFNVNIRNDDINDKIFFIIGIILSVILVLIIIFIINRIILKNNSTFNKFKEEPVEISNSSNS